MALSDHPEMNKEDDEAESVFAAGEKKVNSCHEEEEN